MRLLSWAGRGRASTQRGMLLAILVGLSCQDYPFENRDDAKTEAVRITEVIKTVTPADILFLVDNSGSMVDELTELRSNIGTFVDALSKSQNDYRLGFVTPDIVCNVPERDCATLGGSPRACCLRNTPSCVDDPNNGLSHCDGGRLRAFNGRNRIFSRPPEDQALRDQWLDDVKDTIDALGCEGSGYEAGLEVVRRAVVCSLSAAEREARGLRDPSGTPDACPDPNVAKLNAGFLRDGAALVIIFVSDEDDCSFTGTSGLFMHAEAYRAPTDNFSAAEQALKLCTPTACYAYHSTDANSTNLLDWVEVVDADRRLDCDGPMRTVDPPLPDAVATFLDDIVAAKTLPGETARAGLDRVRAGAVIGGVGGGGGATGFLSRACYFDPNLNIGTSSQPGGPSAGCGCWGNGLDEFCEVTAMLGQSDSRSPLGDASRYGACGVPPPTCIVVPGCQAGETNLNCPSDCGAPAGCQAMMGGRYVDFIEDLATRRTGVGLDPSVVVDSICQRGYADTLNAIVGIISTGSCFALGAAAGSACGADAACADGLVCDAARNLCVLDPARVQIRHQGSLLPKVESTSNDEGWDYDPTDPNSICLVNRDIEVDDRLEIFMVTATTTAE